MNEFLLIMFYTRVDCGKSSWLSVTRLQDKKGFKPEMTVEAGKAGRTSM